jgi:hypothetical protein
LWGPSKGFFQSGVSRRGGLIHCPLRADFSSQVSPSPRTNLDGLALSFALRFGIKVGMSLPTSLFSRREFVSTLAQAGIAVSFAGNAKYHHAKPHVAWRAGQEPEFRLSYLPPYSPDLNPIERVWKLTRRLCLHNCYFPTLAGVMEANYENFFRFWMGGVAYSPFILGCVGLCLWFRRRKH